MSSTILIEGAGGSKELQKRCRKSFSELFKKCGFYDRMPQTIACGGRDDAFDDFKRALRSARKGDFVAVLVDSEDPVADIEATWAHLKTRDKWDRPPQATDDQVFFMTTCMETWIATDRDALREHYGADLQENALPPLVDLEHRDRKKMLAQLEHATRDCTNRYKKGKRSFVVLALLDPDALESHLPSFARMRRILNEKL